MIKVVFPDHWSAEDALVMLELFEHMKQCLQQQYGQQIATLQQSLLAGYIEEKTIEETTFLPEVENTKPDEYPF